MFRVIKSEKEWRRVLENFKVKDVFFNYNYFRIYKDYYNTNFEGIYWKDKNIKLFLTHLIRPIKINNLNRFYYDLVTPYGYGGPLFNFKTKEQSKIKSSLLNFREEYFKYANSKKYVSEFIRFHPLINNFNPFNKVFFIQKISETVVIDLDKPLDFIFSSFKKEQRYNIRKALKEKLLVETTSKPNSKELNNFLTCYNKMLLRRGADKKYFFSKGFIKSHFEYLKGSFLLSAIHSGNCVSSAIFIGVPPILYYHLSGSIKLKGLAPSSLILWEAIKHAKKNNFKYLFLGGGVSGNDSLFRFKSAFSQDLRPFYIGKIIFNDKIYKELVSLANLNQSNSNFFPLYRKNSQETIV